MNKSSSLCLDIKHKHSGFTLVEMAIVLAIVAMLLGGLLPVISSQIEQQRRKDTHKHLEEIKDALIGFAVINGRLPCPADGANASGNEATTGTGAALVCTAVTNGVGVLPWATLGVSEIDAWGHRFTYRVTSAYADGTDGTAVATCSITTNVSFQLCSSANLNVDDKSGAGSISVASNVPAVVISHGANGLGAYPSGGGAQIGTTTGDEDENTDNNNTFVSHDFVQDGFDDMVIWISPNTLINRMVAAGKLP